MTFNRLCEIHTADRVLETAKCRLLSELLYEEKTAIPENSWWGTASPGQLDALPLAMILSLVLLGISMHFWTQVMPSLIHLYSIITQFSISSISGGH